MAELDMEKLVKELKKEDREAIVEQINKVAEEFRAKMAREKGEDA